PLPRSGGEGRKQGVERGRGAVYDGSYWLRAGLLPHVRGRARRAAHSPPRASLMSPPTNVPVRPAPPPAPAGPGLLPRVCTKNPFYALSAGLFLIGLYLSFGAQAGDVDTWALMGGLAGYTLLLAATACLLVRFGNVWDDVRTVLLLVVLLFLATSVTFDEVLVLDPARGLVCSAAGLLFAAAVTEGIL